ncbi:unnamed protein product, partial [Menidia menidia]
MGVSGVQLVQLPDPPAERGRNPTPGAQPNRTDFIMSAQHELALTALEGPDTDRKRHLKQIRVLMLNDSENLERTLFRLEQGQNTGKDTDPTLAKRTRLERSKDGHPSPPQSPETRERPQTTTESLNPTRERLQTTTEEEKSRERQESGGGEGEGSPGYVVEKISAFLQDSDPYILDIDLDFFSCKNPFKELYTE